ncbi:hypothetical protein ACRS7A_22460 [Bacillus cytotoxicus]|uniref:hypothetical protein n=1 Tax=Bacillus cytotoxicus TaxID=580165 RepID=UPI003D7CCB26
MENKKSQRINVILSADNYEWLKRRSGEMGVSMSGFMSMALDNYRMQQALASNITDIMKVAKVQGLLEEE